MPCHDKIATKKKSLWDSVNCLFMFLYYIFFELYHQGLVPSVTLKMPTHHPIFEKQKQQHLDSHYQRLKSCGITRLPKQTSGNPFYQRIYYISVDFFFFLNLPLGIVENFILDMKINLIEVQHFNYRDMILCYIVCPDFLFLFSGWIFPISLSFLKHGIKVG